MTAAKPLVTLAATLFSVVLPSLGCTAHKAPRVNSVGWLYEQAPEIGSNYRVKYLLSF